AGAVVLLFVVPIEMEGVGPRLAGSAIGVVNAAGFAGGVLMPLLGMKLVQVRPGLGLGLWAGCFVLSALCFVAVRETGSRASERRRARRSRARDRHPLGHEGGKLIKES